MTNSEKFRDEDEIIDRLHDASSETVQDLLPHLREWLSHDSELVRIETLEAIADFKLNKFLPDVSPRLEDEDIGVRGYALICLYELTGEAALPSILHIAQQGREAEEIIPALCLAYACTRNQDHLTSIVDNLRDSSWYYRLGYAVKNTLSAFVDFRSDPLVEGVFQEILAHAEPHTGLYRDLSKLLTSGCR